MKDFDVIVIGTGIGGLTCAGLLASKGIKVLALEKNSSPGGYLSSFSRGGFRFDSAVDCFSGLDEKGAIKFVLKSLEVENEISFVRVNPIRESFFPGIAISADKDIKIYIENLKALFPSEKKGIDNFFHAMAELYTDIAGLAETLVYEKKDELKIPTTLLKYTNKTYKDLLDEYIKKEERLKAVLSDRCPFLGLPPSKVSAVNMCALLMSYFESGAYRIIGGCQKLADILVKGIKKKGGVVLFKKEASRILLENNRAIGVRTSDGIDYTTENVVSNIDYLQTFSKLLNGNFSRGVEKTLKTPGISRSFFILYIGTDSNLTKLGNSSSIGHFPSFDMESFFEPINFFEDSSSLGITIPTLLDNTIAPRGCHSILAHEMVDYSYTASWEGKKHALAKKVLKKVEKILPGIKNNIMHLESATPVTLERFTSNFRGAAYGWRQTTAKKTFKNEINNLYIAGHWGEMGGGILASAYSGLKAARSIIKKII